MTGVGGNWTSQNKVRPGAYINFKSVPKPLSSLGTRGIVTFPIAMSWGDTVTKLYSTDLTDGTSLAKVGYSAFDDEAQIYREALKNCYEAIIYRLDTNGVKATATLDKLTATAKYPGVCGNKITVAIVTKNLLFDVVTFYNGSEKDRQTVATLDKLVDNDFVDFAGTGAPTLNAGVALAGGTNGTIGTDAYNNYTTEIQKYSWNTMGIPSTDATLCQPIATFIKQLRDEQGVKVQAVLYNYPTADYEGIISVNQGYTTSTETIAPSTFVLTVAGLTAGAEITQSLTNYAIEDAETIVNEMTNAQIIDALNAGQMVLSKRQSGVIKIEQDINTFVSVTPTKGYDFRKNKVIRCLDEINNSTKALWENSYEGKVNNNASGRTIYGNDVVSYMLKLEQIEAIQNFDSKNDVLINGGDDADAVVADIGAQPVDAMEKLYQTVNIK